MGLAVYVLEATGGSASRVLVVALEISDIVGDVPPLGASLPEIATPTTTAVHEGTVRVGHRTGSGIVHRAVHSTRVGVRSTRPDSDVAVRALEGRPVGRGTGWLRAATVSAPLGDTEPLGRCLGLHLKVDGPCPRIAEA